MEAIAELLLVLGIAAPVVIGLLWCALRSLNISMVMLFLSFLIVDPVRRIIASGTEVWTYFGLLGIDLTFLVLLLSLWRNRGGRPVYSVFRSSGGASLTFLKFAWALMVAWIVLEMFNPASPNLILSLAAVREYLLPIPALALGCYVADRWGPSHWHRAFRFLGVSVACVIALSLIQLVFDPADLSGTAGALVAPAEHGEHEWQGEAVRLVSSVFASSKRYGHFLLLVYPLMWICLNQSGSRWSRKAVTLLLAVGCAISASREALLMLGVIEFILERSKAILWRIVLVIGIAIWLIPGLSDSAVGERLRFSISTAEDWKEMVAYMTLQPLAKSAPASNTVDYLFGIGAGHSGQALMLLSDEPSVTDLTGTPEGFSDDGGFYKLLIDLGLTGIVLFVIWQVTVLYFGFPLRKKLKGDPVCLASWTAIVVWIILFAKAHTTLSDMMAHIFYWFYVGLLVARSVHLRQHEVNHRMQPAVMVSRHVKGELVPSVDGR